MRLSTMLFWGTRTYGKGNRHKSCAGQHL